MATQRIGPYQLIERIGAGGMGEIYLAQRVTDGARVALKLLALHLTNDPQLVERFVREGEALRQLRHPHIVETYGAGQADGRHYLAMAFVPGGNLAEWMRQIKAAGGRVPVDEALRITRQMALALDYAHSKGFVHRDVKPANILRGEDGRWMLSDFGLVLMSDRTRLTHTGGYMGTPAYSSPEQAKGLPLDGRSDIYSLGAVLYELLAGSVPFDAPDTPAMLHAIVHTPPPRLSRVRPDVSAAARNVAELALSKKPEGRFQTAGQMLSAIDSATIGSAKRGPGMPTQPKLAIAGAAALVILLIASVAIIGTLSLSRQRNAPASASDATLTAPTPEATSVAAPSSTPQSTATLQAVVEAPTDTPAPTPTPEPTLVSTQSPTPTLEPTPCASTGPYPLDDALLKDLGCPADKFVPSRNVVTQQFDNGFMIIFDDAKNSNYSGATSLYKFYIVLNDGRAWRVYFPNGTPNNNASPNPDDWYSCEVRHGLRPKDSRIPWRGFGMVWCQYPAIRAALGYVRPGADEVPGKAAFQSYQTGRTFVVNGRRYTVVLNIEDGKPDTFVVGRWQ